MPKMPDITPMQTRAVVLALVAFLASIGLPLSEQQVDWLLTVAMAVPVVLIAADALIRFGRSLIFRNPENLIRYESSQPVGEIAERD